MSRSTDGTGTGDVMGELRGALEERAEALQVHTPAWAALESGLRRIRRRHRRRRALGTVVAGGLAVLLVGGVLPGQSPLWGLRRPAPATDRDGGQPTVTSTDVTSWPTRGSFVGTPRLDEARRAMDKEMVIRSVPFAGELGRVDVIVGIGPARSVGKEPTSIVVLVRPHSEPPDRWNASSVSIGLENLDGAGMSVAVGDESGDEVHLLVLLPSSGGTAAYSPDVDLSPTGVRSRRFTAMRASNGVSTATLRAPSTSTVSVRTTYAGRVTVAPVTVTLPLRPSPESRPRDELFAAASRAPSCRGVYSASEIRSAVAPTLTDRGFTEQDLATVTALWCRGRKGDREGLVAFTTRAGLAFRAHLVEIPGGVREPVLASSEPAFQVPAPRVLDLPGVLRFDEGPGRTTISAPGADRVRVEVGGVPVYQGRPDADGYLPLTFAQADRIRLDRASAANREPVGEAVLVTLDARGQVRQRVPFDDAVTGDPYGTTLDGPVDEPG